MMRTRSVIIVMLLVAALFLHGRVQSWSPRALAGGGQPPVTLSLDSIATPAAPGATFNVNVMLNMPTGSHEVISALMLLSFNPNAIRAIAFTPNTAAFPGLTVLDAHVAPDSSTAGLSVGTGMSAANVIQHSGPIATITFQVVGSEAANSYTTIQWVRAWVGSGSSWDSASENVVGSTTGAGVCITTGTFCFYMDPRTVIVDDGNGNPIPDAVSPSISWVAPVSSEGEVYAALSGQVGIEVSASDSDDGIDQVNFSRWDAANVVAVPLGSTTVPPYVASVDVASLNPGWNEIDVNVKDYSGNWSSSYFWIDRQPANQPPTANAGNDQALQDSNGDGAESVTLSGAGSTDPDGNVADYAWFVDGNLQGGGVSATLSMSVGVHQITLQVTDTSGAVAFDDALVTIAPQPANQPPRANAGPDQLVQDADGNGSQAVSLSGSGSSDPDGSIAAYRWLEGATQLATGATPNITLSVGTHTLTLEVTDNRGAKASDTVVVTVTAKATSSCSVSAITAQSAAITGGYRITTSVSVKCNGIATSGVVVALEYTNPNGTKATATATTASTGTATFTRTVTVTGSYSVRVTNLTKAGFIYNAAGNAVTSKSVTVGSTAVAPMAVSAMTLTKATITGGYRLTGAVTINAGGVAVSGATVSVTWVLPNGTTATQTATTSTTGVATFTRNVTAKGTYKMTIKTVVKSGKTYDASKNVKSSVSVTIT